MSGKTASRVERVIAFYGLDHLCWSEESVEEDLRDPDDFVRKLAADAARLDSGRILIRSRNEFGDLVETEHRGIDLRAAIDAAMQQAPERG